MASLRQYTESFYAFSLDILRPRAVAGLYADLPDN